MKLGIMQPYFFPYIGYFQLIHATDHYIFFDTPQYEKRGWMNRNRIINLKEGTTYISVPTVKAPQSTPINEMRISYQEAWEQKILAQLDIYKKRAPYFQNVRELVSDVFSKKYDSISELNIASVVSSCNYMGLPLQYSIFSKMNLDVPAVCEPDEWALNIAKALGYEEYINAPGGEAFFNKEKYANAGIDLRFILPNLSPYVQKIGRFESGLSIIDVMMYNSPEEISHMLSDYSIK